MFCLSIKIFPSVGESSAPRSDRSVLLPDPLLPTMLAKVPDSISKLIFSSGVMFWCVDVNFLVKFFTCNMLFSS